MLVFCIFLLDKTELQTIIQFVRHSSLLSLIIYHYRNIYNSIRYAKHCKQTFNTAVNRNESSSIFYDEILY